MSTRVPPPPPSPGPSPGTDRSIARKARLLSRHGAFAAVPKEALERLVAVCRTARVAPGETLMRQGEAGEAAFLILSGTVAVEVEGALGKSVVARLETGELVGELAVFAKTPRTATVRALTATEVLVIANDTIRAAARREPDIIMSVIAALGARIGQVNSALVTLTQASRALSEGRFSPEMLDTLNRQADELAHFAEVFRDMAAEIEEKRRLRHEMETAAAIQRAFLPEDVPRGDAADWIEVSARMVPARNVGGDFYDFFRIGDRTLAFAVGDVSGKGTPAALFMGVARTVLKTVTRELCGSPPTGGTGAGPILSRVNDALAEDNASSMFVTLALGLLDLESGALDFASAGHEEAVLLRVGDSAPELLPVSGPALGLFEGISVGSRALRLAPGDRIVLATDGVTEAFDQQRRVFGWDRFLAALPGGAATAETSVGTLFAEVAGFVDGAPPSDDVTALVLRYLGPPGR
ncbi:SpoIIE family protein phosphatase [Rhodobacterales bacterium HKCCSP123]|nr:SpoIIE family protein phosphatase [Rhodobacterales bacterium HKCCSP123]